MESVRQHAPKAKKAKAPRSLSDRYSASSPEGYNVTAFLRAAFPETDEKTPDGKRQLRAVKHWTDIGTLLCGRGRGLGDAERIPKKPARGIRRFYPPSELLFVRLLWVLFERYRITLSDANNIIARVRAEAQTINDCDQPILVLGAVGEGPHPSTPVHAILCDTEFYDQLQAGLWRDCLFVRLGDLYEGELPDYGPDYAAWQMDDLPVAA